MSLTRGFHLSRQILQILACTILISCSWPQGAVRHVIGVARACVDNTPEQKQIIIKVIPRMENAGYGSYQCFEKGTEVELPIASVKVFKNKFGGGTVRVIFTKYGEKKFINIAIQDKNVRLVYLNKNGALFGGISRIQYPQNGLVIVGPNLEDAKNTAGAILEK